MSKTAAACSRPHADPRSTRTGPDLEGGDPVVVRAPAQPTPIVLPPDPAEPIPSVEAAWEHVAQLSLRPAPPGPVGLEAEWHVVDRALPHRRPGHARIHAISDTLALPAASRITTEPGGQVEISSALHDGVLPALAALDQDSTALRAAFAADGLGLCALGADPLRAPHRVHPGSRYEAMEAAFAAAGHGTAAAQMMTSTASLQINLEAGPSGGLAARFWLAQALGPALLTAFASSPLINGTDTGWCSARQLAWLRLDPTRTRALAIGRDDTDDALRAAWARFALDAAVLVVPDGDTHRSGGGRAPFAAWIAGEADVAGRRATWADLAYHLTTLWPPVRMRGFLELRWLDALPAPLLPLAAAAVVTLLDHVPDRAAAIVAPVAGKWHVAARWGLQDQPLQRAAVALLQLAAEAFEPTDAALATRITTYAQTHTAQGRSPVHDVRRQSPLAALLSTL